MDCQKVINVALNEVGYLEKRTNTNLDSKTANAGYGNYTKYARDLDNIKDFYNGKKNGYAWCDVFVDWCFVKAYGVETAKKLLCQPSKSTGAGVGFSMNFYKSKGQFYTSPKVGDQIFFTQNGELTHTGLVYKVDSSTVYTIEGNTSSAAGVVANGGAVAKKSYRRSSAYIFGYGRPDYDGTGTSASDTVDKDTSDKKEESAKKHIVDVDGQWGPDTTIKAQEVFGTTVDGIVTDQYKMYKSQNPGLFAFEWLDNPSSYGSELIRAIQKKVGANVDGHIGPETIKKMQKWLGTVQDGYVSNPSDMVKAFQKWLNKQ